MAASTGIDRRAFALLTAIVRSDRCRQSHGPAIPPTWASQRELGGTRAGTPVGRDARGQAPAELIGCWCQSAMPYLPCLGGPRCGPRRVRLGPTLRRAQRHAVPVRSTALEPDAWGARAMISQRSVRCWRGAASAAGGDARCDTYLQEPTCVARQFAGNAALDGVRRIG
jgi:hypothetical protein